MPYPGKTKEKVRQMARGCFAQKAKAGKDNEPCHRMMRYASGMRKKARS